MSLFKFDNNVRKKVRDIIEYANQNIYQVDDILDMMNKEITVPGEKPEHLVLAPLGRWICYYLVDHPQKGLSHYFQIKPNSLGKLPDKPELEYILKEFDIETPLLEEYISIDETAEETKVVLPFNQ